MYLLLSIIFIVVGLFIKDPNKMIMFFALSGLFGIVDSMYSIKKSIDDINPNKKKEDDKENEK